jgi:phage shock protein PspC (stress-responsive transcriptional regulator)
MSTHQSLSRSPTLRRAEEGQWLGGVCAGIAPVNGVGAGWLRLAFTFAALVGGLGIVVYLACWLIMPLAGEEVGDESARGVVIVARACAGLAGLAVLALVGAVATVFGFGWIIAGAATIILVGVLLGTTRVSPGWALLPVAALTLPAVAVATSGVRLELGTGASGFAPRTVQQLSSTVYRSGLGTMLVDLRRTPFPAGGTIPMRIDAGVRRTIVALPDTTCVHVVVRYDVNPFAVRAGALLTGRRTIFSDLVLFGRLFDTRQPGGAAARSSTGGPVLRIDFSSQGGSLYVRDYPTTVDPELDPDWPGYPVQPEPRPDLNGVPRRAAEVLVRGWLARLPAEINSEHTIDREMPGPCGA